MVANNALADGVATNSVTVVIKDASGNPVAGQTLAVTASNGAVVSPPVVTDASGEVTITLTSTQGGLQ